MAVRREFACRTRKASPAASPRYGKGSQLLSHYISLVKCSVEAKARPLLYLLYGSNVSNAAADLYARARYDDKAPKVLKN